MKKINWLNYTGIMTVTSIALYFTSKDPDIKKLFLYFLIGFGIVTLLLLIKKMIKKK